MITEFNVGNSRRFDRGSTTVVGPLGCKISMIVIVGLLYANAGLVAVPFAQNGNGNENLYMPIGHHFFSGMSTNKRTVDSRSKTHQVTNHA